MTQARKQRLKEARNWFPEQHFTDESNIISAYRKRFNVDKTYAMRELVMLGVLSPKKKAEYKRKLEARKNKFAEKRKRQASKHSDIDENPWQDEQFFFIAGYTSGGIPYWPARSSIQ